MSQLTEQENTNSEEPTTENKPVKISKLTGKPKRKYNLVNKSKYKNGQLTRRVTAKVIQHHLQGLPIDDSARAIGIHPNAIKLTLKTFAPVLEEIKNLDELRNIKSDILDATGFMLIKSMLDPAKLDKASVNNIGYAYQVINTASRLEKGLSTENKASFTKILLDTNSDTEKPSE